MTNSDMMRSILTALKAGKTYQQWVFAACAEFRLFQNPLEKRLISFITDAQGRPEGKTIMMIVSSFKGLPGTVKPKPKSPVLAGKLTGKQFDFSGRPIMREKKVKMGKVSPLSRFQGVAAGKADRKRK